MTMSDKPTPTGAAEPELKLHGVLAEYQDVDTLLAACEKVRDAGYRKWDAHTPFPVHGIEDAMGVKMTILPWIVMCGGITGLGAALLMQWWMNAVDYPFLISGKPYFSLPANIPVCFELTVLFSALTTFFSVLGLNLLPQLYHPLFRSDRFKRATDDRFFISIDAKDPLFEPRKTAALLAGTSSLGLEDVHDEVHHAPFPRGIIYVLVILAAATFIPLALIAKARLSTSTAPRIHLVWDMDWQKKFKTQRENPFFADGRAMRPQVAGTVARGDLLEDKDVPFHTGIADPSASPTEPAKKFVRYLPIPAAEINEAFLARGKERYEIYCAPCHGLSGAGDGIVATRAAALAEGVWVPPLSYHQDNLRQPEKMDGDIFNTITNGLRTMPSYGSQIPPRDRWAIVLYVRALQRSQWATIDDVPAQYKTEIQNQLGTK